MANAIVGKISSFSLVAVQVLILVVGYTLYDISFYRHDYLTGWLLFYLMLIQLFYYIQKRLGGIALPGNLQWLQLHTEFGLIAVVIFFFHLGWKVPSGGLGIMLAISFLLVAVTGVLGLLIKRRHQNMLLRQSGRDLVFEEIPRLQSMLHKRAEALMVDCAADNADSLLAKYYSDKLVETFSVPDNLFGHLVGDGQLLESRLGEIEKLMPYLNESDVDRARTLMDMLERKDRLDYYYAHQGALKIWLLIHVPLACALLVLVLMHMLLVYAFAGGG